MSTAFPNFLIRCGLALAGSTLLLSIAHAQTWSRTFGEPGTDIGYGISVTADGGLLATAGRFGSKSRILRLDGSGGVVWEREFFDGFGLFPRTFAVERAAGGYWAVANSSVGFLLSHMSLMSLDAGGGIVSASGPVDATYEIETEACVLHTTSTGRLMVGGELQFWPPPYTGDRGRTGFVSAYDAVGNPLWHRCLSTAPNGLASPEPQVVMDVAETPGGGTLAVGFMASLGLARGFLVQLDAAGTMQWGLSQRAVAPLAWSTEFRAVTPLPNGTFVLAGSRRITSTGSHDAYLACADGGGNILWERTYPASEFSRFFGIETTPDGTALVTGWLNDAGGMGSSDLWLVEVDATGNILRQMAYGGALIDWGTDVVRTPDGGYAIIGRTSSFGVSDTEAWVLKVDAEGGSCVPSWVTNVVPVPVTSDLDDPVYTYSVSTTYVADPWTESAGTGGALTCHVLDPGLVPVGGNVGGSLSFQFQMSSFPGHFGFVGLSYTGGSFPLGLPGQVTVFLNPDELTTDFLGSAAHSLVVLDGSGAGATAPFPVPNDPALAGLPLWAVGVAHQPGATVRQATQTVEFQLQ